MNLKVGWIGWRLLSCCALCISTAAVQAVPNPYPAARFRQLSPGKTNYFIDPNTGDDKNTGLSRTKPWKTFLPINQILLSAGDQLEVLSPGAFHESLVLKASGTPERPVRIRFAAGRYDLFPDGALRQQLHISNTNNTPYEPKAIALMLDSCRFTEVQGPGAQFILRGKMIELYLNKGTNIQIDGLSFDYKRPTVSELMVTDVQVDHADLAIHPDSKYGIADGKLTWIGEGWRKAAEDYWQVLDPLTNQLSRLRLTMSHIRFVQTGVNQVRACFTINPGFKTACIYQTRDITRDCAGLFLQHCQNVEIKNVHVYFMHGMGVVSQLCENVKIDSLVVRSEAKSGRTCAAWADILHFSGCRGKIEIANSYLSGANDDAVNVHGVHLKIKEIIGKNQVLVVYPHNETYGFNPYVPGDSLDFVYPATLLARSSNVVASAVMRNDKEILITLQNPVASDVNIGDVVENTTTTPEVWIHDNVITRIPTRGVLLTSRRKLLVERNDFQITGMSAVLVSDDAAFWYESGPVKDLCIQHNHFFKCGEPVIDIHPENTETGQMPVHRGISVSHNLFDLLGKGLFAAKSTSGIIIKDNTVRMATPVKQFRELIELRDCSNIQITDHNLKP